MGIYPTHARLEFGVQALKEARFRSADISVLYPEEMGKPDPARDAVKKSPDGAATGASAGVLVGGALGWLAGVGRLAIPGLGLFVATGPIVAALMGASAGGALGGIMGGLVGLGLPAHEAERFRRRLLDGGTLLSVRTDNSYWTSRARDILERTGAEEILIAGDASASGNNKDHFPPPDPAGHWMQ